MFSHRLVKVREKHMVTQKKEMEDLDAEYTMKQHMEQQTLMRKIPSTSRRTTRSTTCFQDGDFILWTR